MNHSALVVSKSSNHDVLRQALIAPEILPDLQLSEWDCLLPEARSAGLLARLDVLLRERGIYETVPSQVKPHLVAVRRMIESEQCAIRWEMNRIERALANIDTPIVLLKGAAYLVRQLPNARGRISSDVDILVAKEKLKAVEDRLLKHGWRHIKLEEYDQYFYRKWSHELPPLQHRDRGTIVDVHHTILPPTGRLRPDARKLLTASTPVEGTIFRVLAPADMVLHSAAHAFQDGDLTHGLRDLVDIDDLLHCFSARKEFWQEIISRAEELDLRRPLYYVLRYSNRYLKTPIPQHILDRAKSWRPGWPAPIIMDTVVDHVVTAGPWRKDRVFKLSQELLYMRAHWLRMPAYLLIPHLMRKALMKRAKSV
jgi:hypothetical protein